MKGLFAGKGFSVMEMDGGFEAWKENDLEVEKGNRGEKSKKGSPLVLAG